jgi:uncharacterized protein (DUF1330 family)
MLRWIIAAALVAIIASILFQEARYLRARRDVVHDWQPLLHSSRAFHVVTFLHLRGTRLPVTAESRSQSSGGPVADRQLFAALRDLREASEAGGDAQVVYAGKIAVNALASRQLVDRFGGEVPWSAVLLTQFDSRAAADRVLASERYREALARFDKTYGCGMKRSPWLNLGIPVILLRLRIGQILSREPSHFPFVPDPERAPAIEARAAQLLQAREYGEHAVVVANLLREGGSSNAAADRRYTRQMFGMMAEGVHGPMHVGEAVSLVEGDQFDRVALVYYPGVQFFADLMRSRFYLGIVGDKQLADTQASITVPVLDRL